MTLLRPINFGELLGDIRPQQQVSALEGVVFGLMEAVSGLRVIATLPRYDTDMAINLAAPRRLLVSGNCQQLIALHQCLVEPTPCDVQLHLVDCEVELAGAVTLLLERARRLVVSLFRVTQLSELHVCEGDVIEDLR